jgi:hypothetical protein
MTKDALTSPTTAHICVRKFLRSKNTNRTAEDTSLLTEVRNRITETVGTAAAFDAEVCHLQTLTAVTHAVLNNFTAKLGSRVTIFRPPLRSTGQSSWLQTQRSRIRFPALSDFSEWQWVWNGVHSALVRINEELLERKLAAPVYETEINDREGSAALTTRHPVSAKVGTKFHQQVTVAQSV